MTELEQDRPPLWFGKKEGGLRIAPLTWQGHAATTLYCFLVVVAVFTYSQLTLTVFVIVFYTVAFGLLVFYKSDLMENGHPAQVRRGTRPAQRVTDELPASGRSPPRSVGTTDQSVVGLSDIEGIHAPLDPLGSVVMGRSAAGADLFVPTGLL